MKWCFIRYKLITSRAKTVSCAPVVNIFVKVHQPKHSNIILVLPFVFISSILLDNFFFCIFSYILTYPRPLFFEMQVVASELWNQFSQSYQSLKKLKEIEQKILQCVTCRKDKFDLTENFVSVECWVCARRCVYVCLWVQDRDKKFTSYSGL